MQLIGTYCRAMCKRQDVKKDHQTISICMDSFYDKCMGTIPPPRLSQLLKTKIKSLTVDGESSRPAMMHEALLTVRYSGYESRSSGDGVSPGLWKGDDHNISSRNAILTPMSHVRSTLMVEKCKKITTERMYKTNI